MGIEQYMKLCEKLRAKSEGVTAALDHSALVLDDSILPSFAYALSNSNQPVPALSLNISRIGTSGKRNATASSTASNTCLPHGLNPLLHYIRASPCLLDVRLSGSECCARPVQLQTIVKLFIAAIEENPFIKRLGLYNLSLDAGLIAPFIRRSKSLQHLSLVCCHFFDRTTNGRSGELISRRADNMSASFALNKSITSLRLVDLDENITISILEQLKMHRMIEKLDVSCDTLNVASMIGQLAGRDKNKESKLSHMVLRDSSLQGFDNIVRSLTCELSPIQRLDIVNCSIDAVSAALFRTLFRCTKHKLQHVTFYDARLNDETVFEEILDGLICSKTIYRLTLQHITLQQRDYQALLRLLHTNKTLTDVCLDRTVLAYVESQRRRIGDIQPIAVQQQQHHQYKDSASSIQSDERILAWGGTLTTV
jgi:hypothetical protein